MGFLTIFVSFPNFLPSGESGLVLVFAPRLRLPSKCDLTKKRVFMYLSLFRAKHFCDVNFKQIRRSPRPDPILEAPLEVLLSLRGFVYALCAMQYSLKYFCCTHTLHRHGDVLSSCE